MLLELMRRRMPLDSTPPHSRSLPHPHLLMSPHSAVPLLAAVVASAEVWDVGREGSTEAMGPMRGWMVVLVAVAAVVAVAVVVVVAVAVVLVVAVVVVLMVV